MELPKALYNNLKVRCFPLVLWARVLPSADAEAEVCILLKEENCDMLP